MHGSDARGVMHGGDEWGKCTGEMCGGHAHELKKGVLASRAIRIKEGKLSPAIVYIAHTSSSRKRAPTTLINLHSNSRSA